MTLTDRPGIDLAGLGAAETYKLLTGALVPRPVAWVSTVSPAGVVNLAPFSSFGLVCTDPPTISIGIDVRPDGRRKDTALNLRANGEFVVHIADQSLLGALHASSAEMPPQVSELEALGLPSLPSTCVAPPRVAQARVALECRVEQILPIGEGRAELVIGRVLHAHVDAAVLRDGRIDSSALDPVCRLGGPNYAALGRVTRLERV